MKVNIFNKELKGEGVKIAVVRSRFNKVITECMLGGCLETLKNAGVKKEDVIVVEVPGAFEVPLAVQSFAKKGEYDAIITLGCVLRGETPHDVYICDAVIPALIKLSLDYSLPVILGIITPLNQQQAEERSSGENNKGIEAAKAALEVLQAVKNI